MTEQVAPPPAAGVRFALNCLWWWQPLFYFCTPVIEIDGQPRSARWGKQDVGLQPGTHHVRIYFPYLGKKETGLAATDVAVADGQWVNIAYGPPFSILQPGKIRVTA